MTAIEIIRKLEGKEFVVNSYGRRSRIALTIRRYANDRTAIKLSDADNGSPFGVLTVNIPEAEIADNEIIVKTWSENEALAKAALATGLFRDTGRRISTGWVEAQVWEVL